MYRSDGGTLSLSKSGDGLVQVLDLNDRALASMTFPFDFTALTDPPITLNDAPFAFALPDLPNAMSAQILRNDVVLVRVNIASKLLTDAINSVPSAGFDTRRIVFALTNRVLSAKAWFR